MVPIGRPSRASNCLAFHLGGYCSRRYIARSICVLIALTACFLAEARGDTHVTGVPQLNSDPGAPYTIYLDFSGFNFTGMWGGNSGPPGSVAAYANASGSFSSAEQTQIAQIWAGVAQGYLPFNVNVTTVDPAISAGSADTDAHRQAYYDQTAKLMHTIVTPTSGWAGSPGGISYVGVTANTYGTSDNGGAGDGFHTNWDFEATSGFSPFTVAQPGLHENGHGLGLVHQSDYVGDTYINEYSTGDNNSSPGTYSPIMGAGYYTQRATWRLGDSNNGQGSHTQNDVAEMLNSSPGLALVNDGIGHSYSSATVLPLNGSSVYYNFAQGIIVPASSSSPTPIGAANYTTDFFSFKSDGQTPVNLTANDGSEFVTPGSADVATTLRSTLTILNSSGGTVGSGTEAASTLSESYSALLPAGTYEAEIASYGGHTQTITSGSNTFNTTYYFDMGGYFLTGSGFASMSSFVWSSTATGPWNVAANWGGSVPGPGDIASFTSSSYANGPNLTTSTGAGALWQTGSGAITITGSALTLYSNVVNSNSNVGIEMDAGAGSLTINVPLVLPSSQTWINNSANPLTINNSTSGAGSLTKQGSGTLNLLGTTTCTNFFPNGGTTIITGSLTSSSYSSIAQANGSNGTVVITGTGSMTVNGDFNVSDLSVSVGSLSLQGASVARGATLYVGKYGSSVGILNMSGGSMLSIGSPGEWRIGGGGGTGDAAAYGNLVIANSSALTTSGNFQIGAFGLGVLNQTSGTITSAQWTDLGRFVSGFGVGNISGGQWNATGTGNPFFVGEDGNGVLNLSGSGLVSCVNGMMIGNTSAAGGVVNLSGGTLLTTTLFRTAGTMSVFNFNGGTLKAAASNTTFLQGLDSAGAGSGAFVWNGGGTIDNGGFNIAIGQALLAPTGSGVSSIALSSSGSGYLGEPVVEITGGGGTGATARAIMSGGQITSILITNPGTGYTSPPTISVSGGGYSSAATLGAAALAANSTSGALTFIGGGTTTLSGNNTYSGGTTINAGAVSISSNNNLGGTAGAVTLNGGALATTAGITNTHPFTIGTSGGTIDVASPSQYYFHTANTLLGNGPLTLTGTGALISAPGVGNLRVDVANSYSGNMTLQGGGIFEFGAAGAVSANAAFTLNNQGELALNTGVNSPNNITVAGGTNSVLSFINDTGGVYSGQITLNAGATIGLRDWYNYSNVRSGTITGQITGSGGLSINSGSGAGGALALGNSANNYSGGTTVNSAILLIGAQSIGGNGATPASEAGALGSGTVTVNSGGMAQLGYREANTDLATVPNAFVVNGGDIWANDAYQHIAGNVNVTANGGTLGSTYEGQSGSFGWNKGLFLDGVVSGSGALTLDQAGAGGEVNGGGNGIGNNFNCSIVMFSNSANSYSGTVTVAGGSTGLNNYLGDNASAALEFATVNVVGNNSGGNLRWGTSPLLFQTGLGSCTLGALGGSGNIALLGMNEVTATAGTDAIALTVGGNDATTNYSGALSGPGSLTKVGTGTLVLSGTDTYSGGTIVLSGKLKVMDAYSLLDGSNLSVGTSLGLFQDAIVPAAPIPTAPIPSAAAGPPAPVPEPGTLALVATVLLAIAAIGARRRYYKASTVSAASQSK